MRVRASVTIALALAALSACGGPAPPRERPATIVAPPPQTSTPPPAEIPRLARVLASYERGKNDQEMKRAAEEVLADAKSGVRTDRATADALWACFMRYEPSKTNSILGTQLLHDAVLAVKDPSYGDKALAAIRVPASRTPGRVNDQLEYWQTTAIQILRALRYEPAAKALVAVLLTKSKQSLANLADAAIRSIAAAAVPVLAAALAGSDPDLAKLEAEWGPDREWVAIVLHALGETTLPRARDAIVAFVPHLGSDANRLAAAQSLLYFPTTPRTVSTFEAIYESLPPVSKKGDTGGQRAVLLAAAGQLFDGALAAWALREASKATGEQAVGAQYGALTSAIALMGAGEKPAVARALARFEHASMPAAEKKELLGRLHAMFDQSAAALGACGRNASCYVKLLEQPIPAGRDASWKAVKAARMAGMLGDDETRKDLVARLPNVKDAAARLAMALAINHLAPGGDTADADALDRIVADDLARRDFPAMRGDDALTRVAAMLRARK
jgi:hypothetical protein